MINTNKPLSLTQAEIQDWESKDINSRKVECFSYEKTPGSNEYDNFWVVKPTRTVLNVVATYATEKEFEKANDFLINNCVIAGDTSSLEKDDDLYSGLLKDLSDLVKAKKKISRSSTSN